MLYILLLAASLAYASAASLPPTLDLTSIPSLPNLTSTYLRPQANRSAVDGDIWLWYCTKMERWSLPKLDSDDCLGALDWFYLENMQDGGTKRKDFVAPGGKKTTYTEMQWTPRKYTFGEVYSFITKAHANE